MAVLFQDVKFGFRMMARTPMVTLVAVLSLALGIAANASMFSMLNSFLFAPLPYADQEELVLFRTLRTGDDIEMAGGISVPNFRDIEVASRSIESSMVYTTELANFTGLDTPEQLTVVVATPSLFEVLGVQPALGRGFRPEEGADGSGNVVVLEYDYWQRRFLGDQDVLGRTITLDGSPYTIVGVMPEDFDMIPANVHAFRPSDFAGELENRGSQAFLAFARLSEGATASRLQLEVDGTARRLVEEYPDANRGMEFVVQTLREFFPGPTDTQLLKILTAVTLFGLLIACANVANLLLGRAEERQKEVAVRTALGAGRGRILRQLLTESVLMATSAGIVGSVLAIWVVGWLRTVMPAELPAALSPSLDVEVLIATLFVSILAGIAFGLVPALHSIGGNLRESLGNGVRGGTAGRRRRRLRNVFVIGEVAVALAVLSGSGFLIQAFDRLANDDPGFDPSGLLTFQLSVLEDRYEEDADIATYERELVRVLEEIPAVHGVAIMSSLPRSNGNPQTRYTVDGRPVPEANEQPRAGLQAVNAEYFATMDIPVREGRLLTDADREDSPNVALVSEALVARDFPNEDPIGQQISVRGRSRQIVGVVGDILQDRVALAGRAGEQIYLPIAQFPLRNPSFALRTSGDPAAIAADVRQAVWSVEADQPIARLRTLQAHIDESLAGPRSISLFLMVMGGIALALAAMGIYGVMAHSVTQQQREIGIRMALGAGRGDVVGMITRSGLVLVAVGVVGGLPLAYLMFRGTVTMLNLFNTELSFGYPIALSAALIGVAVLATVVPARKASGIAPVAALREE
jgi:putative ABC transport system permease protein